MKIRRDVAVSKTKNKTKPWTVRWWGEYDLILEKQKRFSKIFRIKKKAEKFAQTLKDDRDNGICIDPSKATLSRLCKDFINTESPRLSNETVKAYQDTFKRLETSFDDSRNIKTIQKKDAQMFINNIKLLNGKKASGSTKARHLRNSKRLFNIAIDWNYTRENPFRGIKLGYIEKERWHYITPKEFTTLMNTIEDVRLRAFYAIMYGCGLRYGEAINLLWTDDSIDLVNGKINIQNRIGNRNIPPFRIKTNKKRSVQCPNFVLQILEELKEQSSKQNPFVLLSNERHQKMLSMWKKYQANDMSHEWNNDKMTNNYNRDIRNNFKKAGIEISDKLSAHCFRKAFGTNHAENNTPVHTLKELMGHSSINTTMEYYVRASDENKMKAVKVIDGLMSELRL